MHNTFTKDPEASLDYSWDWTDWLLLGDTIATAVVTPDGLTVGAVANDGQIVTAMISGGTLGKTHSVKCRITTINGLVDDRTIFIQVRNR